MENFTASRSKQKAATPAPMPPGRFLKATRETWSGWFASGRTARWTGADLAAARRLILLVEDFHRAEDPGKRLKLSQAIRTSSRDLGLVGEGSRYKPPSAQQLAIEADRERARATRAQRAAQS